MAAAGVKGGGSQVASAMSATSAQQVRQAESAANEDFQAYQQSVVAQDNAATSAIEKQLQQQAAQKFRAKAEQLQQQETDLSLHLTQADASERLAIKTRLSNLALDEPTHKQLTAQLAAIDAKETATLDARRKADAATLASYRAQLSAQTGQAVRTQVGSIQGQTRAKLEERRNAVGAQLPALGPHRCLRISQRVSRTKSQRFTSSLLLRSKPTPKRRSATITPRRPIWTASSPPFTEPTSGQPAPQPKNSVLCKSVATRSIKRSSTRLPAKRRASQRIEDLASSSST